jgi:hypothetical protein
MSRFGQFGNATLEMNLDVVYVSYRKDLAWLCYSIQLLQKHLSGTYRIVVRLEPDCKEIVDHWGFTNVTYIYANPWPDGYHFAMFEKLCADNYTDTELIMLLDSDHLLLEPVPLENFFWENKPVIRYREWDEDPTGQSSSTQPIVQL